MIIKPDFNKKLYEALHRKPHWTKDCDGVTVCSECEGIALQRLFFSPCSERYEMKFVESKYCPNFGAKMVGESDVES